MVFAGWDVFREFALAVVVAQVTAGMARSLVIAAAFCSLVCSRPLRFLFPPSYVRRVMNVANG